MSRHSKWSKVKQFKGAVDAKRSASFTKLSREITVATREKGPDPSFNVRLRVAIDRAKKGLMPKDVIQRAIDRATGAGAEAQLEQLLYEAYAPGGTALMIECVTDNRNRSVATVKHIVSKNSGTMANAGSVAYLFDRVGTVRITGAIPADRHDDIELALIDAGATDIIEDDTGVDVRTSPSGLMAVADAVTKLGLTVESAEFEWIPKTTVETDEQTGLAVEEIISELEADDDVQRVYSNLA
jgi:YebC/PmpR family DNA-binding regulatory protein